MSTDKSVPLDDLANHDLINALRARGLAVVAISSEDLRHHFENGGIQQAEDLTDEQIDTVLADAFDAILQTNFEEQANVRVSELIEDGYNPVGRIETAVHEFKMRAAAARSESDEQMVGSEPAA